MVAEIVFRMNLFSILLYSLLSTLQIEAAAVNSDTTAPRPDQDQHVIDGCDAIAIQVASVT